MQLNHLYKLYIVKPFDHDHNPLSMIFQISDFHHNHNHNQLFFQISIIFPRFFLDRFSFGFTKTTVVSRVGVSRHEARHGRFLVLHRLHQRHGLLAAFRALGAGAEAEQAAAVPWRSMVFLWRFSDDDTLSTINLENMVIFFVVIYNGNTYIIIYI